MKISRLFHRTVTGLSHRHHPNPYVFFAQNKMAPSRKYSLQSVKTTPWNAQFDPEPQRSRKAYVALGSNLGDRISMLEKALLEMSARGIKIKRTSSLWETKPMYVLDQDNFVNGACEVSLQFFPFQL